MSITERRNPKAESVDTLSTEEVLNLMNEEDGTVISAVKRAIPSIAKAVNAAVAVIRNGGRIFYVGAGTSGRLGLLDASEMPPTFSVSAGLFQALLAGGDEAMKRSVEGAEDDVDAGKNAASPVTGRDMVVGISASGRTPFVLACLDAAKERGARTWLLTCNEIETPIEFKTRKSELKTIFPDGIIGIITGPEVVAGSTRLKAGTATKLALNMFSTATMIKLGRVYKGFMVDVVPSNQKLIQRAEGILMHITGCSRAEASHYLELSGMKPKVALVMKARGVSRDEAEKLLKEVHGFLCEIL